jgi:hypothetical protein
VKGQGNQQDYGFRIYDPRLGKFLSVDPLFKTYPWYTPYQFAGNKPIVAIDLDGLEDVWIHLEINSEEYCESEIKIFQFEETYNLMRKNLAEKIGIDVSMLPESGRLLTVANEKGEIIRFQYLPTPAIKGNEGKGTYKESKDYFFDWAADGSSDMANTGGDRSGRKGMRKTLEQMDEVGFYTSSSSSLAGPYKGVASGFGKITSMLSAIGLTALDIEEKGMEQGLTNGGIRVLGVISGELIDLVPIPKGGESVVTGLKIPINKGIDLIKDEAIKKSEEQSK